MFKLQSSRISLAGIHVIFWLILLVLPVLIHPDQIQVILKSKTALFSFISRYLLWFSFFYLNVSVLLPRFIFTGKYRLYFLLSLLLITGFTLLQINMTKLISVHAQTGYPLFTVFTYLIIWAYSSVFQIFQVSVNRERENMKTELMFLRSQVSPHFMFNVLNNMVSLARKKSDVLEPSLMKFSALMRYMLYDTAEEKKNLVNEIAYLQAYIDLQEQRFGKSIHLTRNFQQNDLDYQIEPMLLIPFVENAFKHGATDEGGEIDVNLRVKNQMLYFVVRNKFWPSVNQFKHDPKGIGLSNVKRRLNLLYKDTHKLTIINQGDWYTAILELKLDKL